MMKFSWKQIIREELAHAQIAKDSGKEGMARVCSRRAAGAAIRNYCAENELPDPGPSAIDCLNNLKAVPGIPMEALQAAQLLTLRVDKILQLPVEADLIKEARKLIVALLPDSQFHKD